MLHDLQLSFRRPPRGSKISLSLRAVELVASSSEEGDDIGGREREGGGGGHHHGDKKKKRLLVLVKSTKSCPLAPNKHEMKSILRSIGCAASHCCH